MKRVLLFNSPILFSDRKDIFEAHYTGIRYGIASIAGNLRRNGIEVKILEPHYQTVEEIRDIIRRFEPALVGIPAYTTEIYDAAGTAELVKDVDPRIITILGGAHITALPGETMDNSPQFDIGVLGEGEETVLEIARGKDRESIDGIIFRSGPELKRTTPRARISDLSELAEPAFDLYKLENHRNMKFYGGSGLFLPVESMRGCPFACVFCFRTIGRQPTYKDPVSFVNELESYVDRYGLRHADFIDGTFGVNKDNALAICNEIISRGLNLKFRWSANARADTLDEELIDAISRAGCTYLKLGIESGNDAVLEKSSKGITTAQIRSVVRICRAKDLFVRGNFIFGLPGDTEETIGETIDFAKSLPIDHVNFAILVPFPGTEIYRWAKRGERGYSLESENYQYYGKQLGGALRNSWLSSRQLQLLQRRAYWKFYLSSPRRMREFASFLNPGKALQIIKRLFTGVK
ncbi:MAG TPA: radical SAM protein [Proteobacteria bacterium]|nr:radical SAM protein [Pseudomonadota bacterium]